MASGFVVISLPPVLDFQPAARTLEELAGPAPAIVSQPDLRRLLEAASGNSPFLARVMLKEAAFLPELLTRGPVDVLAALNAEVLAVADLDDETSAMRSLRVAKRRAALAIGLADIGGQFDVMTVTQALTRFADSCVTGAVRFLLQRAAKTSGKTGATPQALEQDTGLIILAMGKMGAFELNYSSDTDLIVFYEEERFPFTQRGEKRIAAV